MLWRHRPPPHRLQVDAGSSRQAHPDDRPGAGLRTCALLLHRRGRALSIEVRLNVYTTPGWYVYGRTQAVGLNETTTAMADELPCNTYGWGGSFDGYRSQNGFFRAEVRSTYYDASNTEGLDDSVERL